VSVRTASVRERGRPGPGRPRDPAIDQRIRDAALDLYGNRGYAGVTMNDVARQARVGKAALYLRYATKDDLLADAIISASPHFEPEDAELAPRDLLLAIGTQMQSQYSGLFGRALVRLALDADQTPELHKRVSRMYYLELAFGVDALDAAAPSGENYDSINLIEALGGAILMRVLFTTGWDDPRAAATQRPFVERIVELIAPPHTPDQTAG
jgi:AcrR family transcriptional regulator